MIAPAEGVLEPPPVAAAASEGERSNLDRTLVSGLAWTGSVKWLSQLGTWASTIVVARLLTPADYGLVGMATAYIGLLALLGEFGLGTAIVNLRQLTREQVEQLNSAAVLCGVAAFLIACAVAWPVSVFFATPQVVPVAAVLSLTLIASGFKLVPGALLQRQLRFRRLAIVEGLQALLLAVFVVVAAFAGLRYWTLVIGAVVGVTLSTVFTVASHPCAFARPRLGVLRPILGFSSRLLVQRLAWYSFTNADFIVVGRILGKSALGSYTLGWELAHMAIDKITSLVLRVTPGVFSAVQADRAALRRYFLRLTELISLLTFPFSFGLALVADDFVLVTLGEGWSTAILPLRLLTFYTAFATLTPLLPQILNVTGRSRFLMYHSVATAIVMPISFIVGARWGTAGVAWAWIAMSGIVFAPVYRRVAKAIDLHPGEYLRAIFPAAAACLFMALVVLPVKLRFPAGLPLAARLATEVGVGACAYLAVVAVLQRDRLRQHRTFLEMLRS